MMRVDFGFLSQNKEEPMKDNQKNSCQNSQSHRFTQMSQVHKDPTKGRFREASDEVRTSDEMIDFVYPSVQFPSNRIFKAIGEEKIREMIAYHHNLLLKTKVGKLFPANEEAFAMTVNTTADFFVQALGGGDVFTSAHGEPRLRQRHFKIPIDESDREIWLAMYKKTLKELGFPREHLEEFWNWIEPLSIRMINRRTTMDEMKRHFWADVKNEFLDT